GNPRSKSSAPTSSSSCPTATFPRPTTNPSAHCALAPPIGKSPTASAPSGAQNNTPTSAPSSKPAADSQSAPSRPSKPHSPRSSKPISPLQGEQLLCGRGAWTATSSSAGARDGEASLSSGSAPGGWWLASAEPGPG